MNRIRTRIKTDYLLRILIIEVVFLLALTICSLASNVFNLFVALVVSAILITVLLWVIRYFVAHYIDQLDKKLFIKATLILSLIGLIIYAFFAFIYAKILCISL